MGERVNLNEELAEVRYSSFNDIFTKFRSLAEKYGSLPAESLYSAFGRVSGIGSMYSPNPLIQNNRVKGISSRPIPYEKDKVAEMLKKPENSEKPLREVERALEYTAYPLFHTRTTYQNLLTYHNYVSPRIVDEADVKKPEFMREWRLAEKLRIAINPKAAAHEITGQALQEGKVFYVPRISVDKVHNRINYAFMQQLPSDWTKIVGFNNKSKYTVAFNLMYFTKMGTDPRQFGDLFLPYLNNFDEAVYPAPSGVGKKVVYAEKSKIDLEKVKKCADSNVDAYYQNGVWYYWVTLPVDKVFTFEIDDTNRNVVSPFTGLFIDLIQLSQLEQIQLELLQNPLISLLHGEIETFDTKDTNTADQYKISNAAVELFTAMWYDMLNQANTNGIGIYMAPLRNMKLESLSEAPSAMDIVSTGYQDTMAKAGLSAIIPTSDEARAGAVQVSMSIESRFAETIYTCFERMMNVLIEKLNLKYDFCFKMFGSLATDEEEIKNCRNDMTLGILPATLRYCALKDMSIFEDMSVSAAIKESGLLDLRLPLVTSYSAKNENALPPQVAHEQNPGGREKSETVTSDGNEADVDGAK